MTARKLLALPLAFVGGIILPLFSGCVESDPDHCVNKGGDEFCGEGKYCTNNCGGDYDDQGCLAANAPPPEGCWLCNGSGDNSNCGSIGDGDGDATMTDTTADTSTTDATDTMGTTTAETTSGPECTMSSECAAAEEPLCDAEACVACGDAVTASCAVDYPATPVCDAGSGACVECSEDDVSACSADKPACEGGVCVPCSEHDQCMESACNMSTGACMPTDRVWWVNQSVAGPGTGTEADPFQTVSNALLEIGPGTQGTIYVATPMVHQESVVVAGSKIVAIIGRGASTTLQVLGQTPVSVSNAELFLADLDVANSATGISCSNGQMWISNVVIYSNSQRGFSADSCVTIVDKSVVRGNSIWGGVMLGGELEMTNSVVGRNGVADGVSGGLNLSVGSTAVVRFSTFVKNFGMAEAGVVVDSGSAEIFDSIVLSASLVSPVKGNVSATRCAVDDAAVAGNGNVIVGVFQPSWFASDMAGDYHLGVNPGATPFVDVAICDSADVASDIDGEPRPCDGTEMTYAGADFP